jgi:hypothetical protein
LRIDGSLGSNNLLALAYAVESANCADYMWERLEFHIFRTRSNRPLGTK